MIINLWIGHVSYILFIMRRILATVLDSVTIGDGAVIGAGAVVSKDIPSYAIAVGSPIRIIRYRMTEEKIAAMQRIQWWNWDKKRLQDVEKMFGDIEGFIKKYDKN